MRLTASNSVALGKSRSDCPKAPRAARLSRGSSGGALINSMEKCTPGVARNRAETYCRRRCMNGSGCNTIRRGLNWRSNRPGGVATRSHHRWLTLLRMRPEDTTIHHYADGSRPVDNGNPGSRCNGRIVGPNCIEDCCIRVSAADRHSDRACDGSAPQPGNSGDSPTLEI